MSARIPASVLLPVLLPVRVNVRAVFVPLRTSEPVLVKSTAPLPEASSVPPLVPMVNKRSVLWAEPVYCSVPPLITRLAAALVEIPRPLAVPTLEAMPIPAVTPVPEERVIVVPLMAAIVVPSGMLGLS